MGSPRLQTEFRPLKADWEEWSPDSRSDEEWDWGRTQEEVEMLAELPYKPHTPKSAERAGEVELLAGAEEL